MKATFVLLLLGLLAVNSVYGLKCVICDNCDDDMPEAAECKGDDGEIPTVATGFPTAGTEASSSSSSSTDASSTDGSSTDASSTDGSSTDGSSTDGSSTDASSTDASSTDGSSSSSSSTESSSSSSSSTESSSSSSSTTESTSSSTSSTTLDTESGPLPEQFGSVYSRKTRSANKYLRAESSTAKPADGYQCYKYFMKWGSGTVTKRGCTKVEKCEKIVEANGGKEFITDCYVCNDKDGCNPASNVKSWALSSVILLAIAKMFL